MMNISRLLDLGFGIPVSFEQYDQFLTFRSSFDPYDMRSRTQQPVAGFIVPYKCYDTKRQEKLDRNKMRIRKGRLRLSPNEEAALIKEETEKRRKLRLQQVREQSKENAAKIRHAVKKEKHKQLMSLATDIKNQLEQEKAERVRHLEQQYDNSLRNIGVGHKQAADQPDWSEEKELIQRAENLRAEARGRNAVEKLRRDTAHQNHEAHKHIIARKQALEVERARASEIAAMPPPPPDPLQTLEVKKPKPVKVTDMNTFSTSHYHLQNEHAVDKAGPQEQCDAREAADLEAERIKERALELKRLRQDQLERARLRHNAALEKELLKHDYNNILHDLSDLQRADRERRLKIVHNIPKQVFEPPNARLEDREEKQRNLEEEFENMYMAGTNHLGDISMALDPQPRPMTPSQENSLDITCDGTPMQEPTLPGVPPVLRDMTNMPKPKSPGKKPEKVLRNLMDRIKSQREEWINSQSMMDVGEGQQQQTQFPHGTVVNGDQFFPLLPDESPAQVQQDVTPSPEKLARVQSPVLAQGAPPSGPAVPPGSRKTAMPPAEFSDKLRSANERQQTNVQIQPEPVQTASIPSDRQQAELAEIMRQQELMLEQKRQLELKLQQLTFEQQKMRLAQQATQTQPQAPQAAAGLQGQTYNQYSVPMQHGVPGMMPAQPGVQSQQLMNGTVPAPQPQQYPIAQGQISMMQGQGQPQGTFAQPAQLPGQPVGAFQPPAMSAQQHLASSLSSSGTSMSHRPMNSIPPTHTTGTAPLMTSQGQGYIGYQGQPMHSAYQPVSAALTTDQLATPWQHMNGYPSNHATMATSVAMPTSLQNQTVSPGHIPPASLTSQGMSEQMRKVKEYQQHLLARHEQSKKVLDETKAEIKKRREHLLERYPNLDLSRLEELGAKHLESQGQTSMDSRSGGQGQSVPVSSLLASLAAHPYYAATLSQPDGSKSGTTGAVPRTSVTVGTVQGDNVPSHPDINMETNLRKNKMENIRKSLPFDADESMQTPVRVYEAYAQKNLDTTSATDITESDTSTLTERGSPALKPAARPPVRQQRQEQNTSTTDESELDTTASASFVAERDEISVLRQEELKQQLAEIQRQKEEIIKRHQQGQLKLVSKEEELKAKLATLQPEQLSQQLKDSLRQKDQQQALQRDMYTQDDRQRQHNLSTILEVETPSSARPSDTGMSASTGSEVSQHSKKALDFSCKETILEVPEQSVLEDVETQMQKAKMKKETVAEYSGKNIDDVLERAKRFEEEVLQKLRKQTNAVLFDNEFDDSLEFNVSRRQVSADPLSSGSLTPSSLSTGPLDDTSLSRQSKSGNGSFQSGSKSWATELSQFKIPPSNQSDPPFKLMKPDDSRKSSQETKPSGLATVFSNEKSRFIVYSDINGPESEADNSKSESSPDTSNMDSMVDSMEQDSMNAGAMLQHLKTLQQQLRKGEEEREMLARKLAEQQRNSTDTNGHSQDFTQYSINSDKNVSRPFMPDSTDGSPEKSELSQYSFTDKSTDVSMTTKDQSDRARVSHGSPVQSRTSSQQKELPVRRSPIGDSAKMDPHFGLTNGRNADDVTTTEYSFAMTDSREQRSTSTPGEDRRKSALDGTHRTELPSEITVADKTGPKPSDTVSTDYNTVSTDFKSLAQSSEFSSYSMPYDSSSGNREFHTLSPDRNGKSSVEGLTQYSGVSAEESIEQIKKEFEKLDKPMAKVKTFAVNMDGDLISEHSDSDKSVRNSASLGADLSQFTISSQGSTQDKRTSKLESFPGLSNYTLPEESSTGLSNYTIPDSTTESRLSEYSNKSSLGSGSVDTNPKSSSFTNITTDPSMNMTGATNLSQYTLNDTKDDSGLNENNNQYVQQKFESLDNLISESKTIIARHKEIISKNKNVEEDVPNKTPQLKSNEKETTLSKGNSPKPKSNFLRSRLIGGNVEKKPETSLGQSQDKSGNQSTSMDESSLDYLVEHSTGISEEPQPDLTTMTLGSELSISEAFNKTEELSESTDSLKSFEKHEMSETESGSTSHNFDDSLRDSSKMDSLQEIVEARKHNFMVQSERRAAAAKERALASQHSSENHQVFRAVPVNVVAEPTLSMSVSSSNPDRGLSAGSGSSLFKGGNSEKRDFGVKEKETKSVTSSKALNKALLPRGPDSPKATDSGMKSYDSGTKPTSSSLFSKFGSQSTKSDDQKSPRGRLAGEIRQFGGSSGLFQKASPPTPKKTPPKVAPKPVRRKPEEAPASKPASGLSKTLSSWKKSRAVTGPPRVPEPVKDREALKNSIKVLPEEAPPALTEEERRKRAEDELYEKNIRAYNPRLFRLQHKLDRDDQTPQTSPGQSEKSKDTKKDSEDNLRKNRK